jgi:diacylglycerol kinase (ATP)
MAFTMIVNPNAGKRAGEAVALQAAKELKKHGVDVVRQVSESTGHAVTLAAEIEPGSTDGVIAVGGDGTLFEVLNGLYNRSGRIEFPVGQIPVGTGNSFLKDLEINTVEEAIEAIASRSVTQVDLGRFTCPSGEYSFVNLLGAGFVSNVAYRAGKYKRLGPLSYVFGVLEELVGLKAVPATITVDGEVYKRDIIFAEICNSRYTGGNMMMAPGAEIDDGMFDVVLLNPITRRKLLKLFPSLFSGTHVDDEAVEVLKGSKVTVETEIPLSLTPDGETFGQTPIKAEVLPKAVTMFSGAS